MTEVAEPEYRSVSQYQQYTKCPHAYYLARVEKVWKRPAAWLAHGSAVHEAAEAWERARIAGEGMTREQAKEVFRKSYKHHIDEACEETPNLSWWFSSGRYHGEQDISRRWHIGQEQVDKYIDWREKHPDERIWITPDGEPAVELGFEMNLDGVPVRGFIDAVIVDEHGRLVVRDNKTGATPGDDFQLGVYKVALEVGYGVIAPVGDYWMGKTGKPTIPYDLSEWTPETVAARFKELDENIREKRFDPIPDADVCRRCDVSYDCPFAVG